MTSRAHELADHYLAEQEKRLHGSADPVEAGPSPHGAGLDAEEVERLLIEHDGSVKDAAKELGVGSARLRAFVWSKPELREAMKEVNFSLVDEAVGVVVKAMRDSSSMTNRFYGAKEILRSEAGRQRGFGRDAGVAASIEVKDGDRRITLKWIEPDALPAPKTIEGEAT